MEANELTTHLSEELISRLESVGDFDNIMTSEMLQQGRIYMDIQEDDENEADDIIVLHMDIRQPLHTLKKLIEHKIGVVLKGYVFWLQDAQVLEPHKNLVDQCVKGEGLVQINVQIQTINQRINIVDVLKPTDAALAAIATEEVTGKQNISKEYDNFDEESSCNSSDSSIDLSKDNVKDDNKKSNAKLSWVIDNKFKREQMRLRIPEDPYKWTTPQVKHWFQWAVRQFDLANFVMSDWAITGKELCSLSHEEFTKKLQCDPGKVFWTHLQLLKECKFVSVIQRDEEIRNHDSDDKKQDMKTGEDWPSILPKEHRIMRKNFSQASKSQNCSYGHIGSGGSGGGNSIYTGSTYVTTGNNGQTQLWQFLLEILTNREHIDIIQWVGTEGEFKLTDPEGVARLWGDKKKKPAMNYEKLSRALRYYYDGDMISKVCGKRFAYKFDCDLKLLIGYDAAELAKLVYDCPFLSESALDGKVERPVE